MIITCAHCGKQVDKPTGSVNRSMKNGRPTYCSRKCAAAPRRVEQRKPGWYDLRFTEDMRKVHVHCTECGRHMWLPPSKVNDHNFCDINCRKEYLLRKKQDSGRACETCGKTFYPRPRQLRLGQGRFCSQSCNTAAREALNSPEAQAKAVAKTREMRAAGLIKYYRGEDNKFWKGGPKAYRKRMQESGALAAITRAYRKRNPDKVREFAQNRSRRKYGRLPRGTVAAIGEAQKWKCAICRTGIKKKYHVDHIMPLAKGGKHERSNIQLLCPTCNVRKSAKDPIEYMQSLGRLL